MKVMSEYDLYHAVTRAHPRPSGAYDFWNCSRIFVQFILGGRRFIFGRRGDALRLRVPKGPVAAQLAEIYTVCLHSSYTAENWHVMCNENNVIQKFYHPLRMTSLELW